MTEDPVYGTLHAVALHNITEYLFALKNTINISSFFCRTRSGVHIVGNTIGNIFNM